jgi:Methyltransferase domain
MRSLQPEILDRLDVNDPRAVHSRRDLQKVNALMGHPRFLTRALRGSLAGSLLVELGSGDGTLLLNVARRLGKQPKSVRAIVVDRRPSVSAETKMAFRAVGWEIEVAEADVFDWLNRPAPDYSDVTIANLFLHHFDDHQLSGLLELASRQTRRFVACEPLRSPVAAAGVSLLGLLGCNDVTVHDGRISVRAGFRDHELSSLWPRDPTWRLREWRNGPFTHAFIAVHAA